MPYSKSLNVGEGGKKKKKKKLSVEEKSKVALVSRSPLVMEPFVMQRYWLKVPFFS